MPIDLNAPLSVADPEIAEQIENEVDRQHEGLEMIASENFVSRAVLEAAGTVFTNEASFVAAASAVSLPLPSSDSGDFSISGFSFTASAATFSSFVIGTPDPGRGWRGEPPP